MQVKTLIEKKRGCGYRKTGADGIGLYLIGKGNFEPCERLPFPLTVCPCCGGGIGFFRGFKWIIPEQLFDPISEPTCDGNPDHAHDRCVMCTPTLAGDRSGLMWIGEKSYSPTEFIREVRAVGISKRVASVPRGFEFGKDIIFLAHRKAVINYDDDNEPFSAGIFMSFCPDRIDIVIDDPDSIPARAIALKEKFGDKARLVKIEQDQMSFL